MKKRVADIIMDVLADNGIEQAFCVVGGGAMYLDDALGKTERIKTVFNHHEQASAMAAEGYARFAHKPALCCVTTGPGGTNALTGVMGAYVDSIPMIVVSGQVRYNASVPESGLPLRQRGVQEFNIVETVKTMTKYSKMIINPLEIKREVQKAFDISMSGRRGPVWLDIPQNIQSAVIEEDDLLPVENLDMKIVPKQDEIDKLEQMLKQAKRPVILAGIDIRNSGSWLQFLDFVNRVKVPVVGACVQPDSMYREHPLYCGSSGSVGTRAGNFVLQNSDLLLVLGAELTFLETGFVQENFVPDSTVIMVHADPYEHLKPGLRVNTFIHSEMGVFFEKTKHFSYEASEQWIHFALKLKEKFNVFEACEHCDSGLVNSYNFWKEYCCKDQENSITVLGNNSGVSPRLQVGNIREKQRTLVNVNCGSMGYDLPAAIGAQKASGALVTLVTGDGSFMMNLQELQTIVHNQLPIRIVIFSNDGYNGIRQTCKTYFNGRMVGCDLESGISFPDFEKLAKLFNLNYKFCSSNQELEESIAWLFDQKSACLLIVKQKLDNPASPRVISRLREDGTSEPAFLHDMYPFLDKTLVNSIMNEAKLIGE